jgi:hypothetical protein
MLKAKATQKSFVANLKTKIKISKITSNQLNQQKMSFIPTPTVYTKPAMVGTGMWKTVETERVYPTSACVDQYEIIDNAISKTLNTMARSQIMMEQPSMLMSEMQCLRPEMQCVRPEYQCMRPEYQCMRPEYQCVRPEFQCIKPISSISPRKYRIVCEEVGFLPHTVKTFVRGNLLQVVGLVEIKCESGIYTTKEVRRVYELPRYVTVDKMVTLFTERGQLIIEMPIMEVDTCPEYMRGVNMTMPVVRDETFRGEIQPDNVYVTLNMVVKDEEKLTPTMRMPTYYKYNKTVLPETMDTKYMYDQQKMTMCSPMVMDKCMDYKLYKGCGF